MSWTGAPAPLGMRAESRPSLDALLEAKLHSRPVREDWVVRRRLVDQLDQAAARPVVLVAAPAGFGKTTLLTQWLASSDGPRATAWVTVDPGDDDPVRLWTYVAAALERAGCPLGPDTATFVAANAGEIETRVLPRMLTALAAMPEDVVIVLDDFHFVLSGPATTRWGTSSSTCRLSVMSSSRPGPTRGCDSVASVPVGGSASSAPQTSRSARTRRPLF